jgi:hypothetical protein
MLHFVTFMKILRPILIFLLFAAVGLLAFYLTALASGEPWEPAWVTNGLRGVLLWAYERASIVTIAVLFMLSIACAWLPFNSLLAAVSLSLFYPVYAILRLIFGGHTGNLLPFEFLGYLLFIVICWLGYALGRWLSKRVRKTT